MAKVEIDKKQCDHIIDLLRTIALPEDQEDLPLINLPEDVIKNFYFVVVAICHQTTPLNGPTLQGRVNGRFLKGWDYLTGKLLTAVREDHNLIYPRSLADITSEKLNALLCDDTGETMITDLPGRVLLLQDLGKTMLGSNIASVQYLYDKCDGFLMRAENNGLLTLLSQFKAYSDPVMKKSLFFASLMKNLKLWSYNDDGNLGPPVDYHEIRGHLRYGSVKIICPNLIDKISRQQVIDLDEDIEIRKGVYDAIMYISGKTGITPSVLHYFFWNLFRNCCNRNIPHCDICSTECLLPLRYSTLKKQLNLKGCILLSQCDSKTLDNKIFEPIITTEYY